MVRNLACLLTISCVLFLAACTSTSKDGEDGNTTPAGVDPKSVEPLPPSERDAKLGEAVSFIKGGQTDSALEILYKLVKTNPEDHQIRYILGRTLYDQRSFRASRSELRKVVEINPKHSLAWQKLGDIHQRLGNHPEAISAFTQVAALVPNTIDPLRRIAANYLIRGEPQRGLGALEKARERLSKSKQEDVMLEYLAAKIYEELGNQRGTSVAARAFLRLSVGDPSFSEERTYYQNWLKITKIDLADKDIVTLMTFARSTLTQVVTGKTRPDLIAKAASKRLYAFDESTLFITVIPARGLGITLTGRGRRKNLLSSLTRALDTITTNPAFSKELCKRASIRLSIASDNFEEASLANPGSVKKKNALPELTLGQHGIAFDAGDVQPYVLGCDATLYDLRSVEDMLTFAAKRARLAPKAWAQRRLLRFPTTDFVQPSVGARIFSLEDGEPLPRPVPTANNLSEVALEGGQWLLRNQLSNGAFGQVYYPLLDQFRTNQKDPIEFVQFENLVAIPVQAVTKVTTNTGFEVRKGRLHIQLSRLDRKLLKSNLDKAFGLNERDTKLGEGDIKTSLSYRVQGMKSDRIRLTIESLASPYDLGAHSRAAYALARLYKQSPRIAYLDGAIKAAQWAQERLPKLSKRTLKSHVIPALAMVTEIDHALFLDGKAPLFQKLRSQLATSTLNELKVAIKSPDATSIRTRFQVGEAILVLAHHALRTANDSMFDQVKTLAEAHIDNWSRAQRVGRKPIDPYFASALCLLHKQYRERKLRDFALKIGVALASKIHDPATKTRSAGGVALFHTFPEGPETALANRAFHDLTLLCTRSRKDATVIGQESQYRVAAISAAAFQLRHLIRNEHSYFLPNITRASGAFRSGLFKNEVDLVGMQRNICTLLDVAKLIRDAGSSKPNGG